MPTEALVRDAKFHKEVEDRNSVRYKDHRQSQKLHVHFVILKQRTQRRHFWDQLGDTRRNRTWRQPGATRCVITKVKLNALVLISEFTKISRLTTKTENFRQESH